MNRSSDPRLWEQYVRREGESGIKVEGSSYSSRKERRFWRPLEFI